jgi:hypothetical protein
VARSNEIRFTLDCIQYLARSPLLVYTTRSVPNLGFATVSLVPWVYDVYRDETVFALIREAPYRFSTSHNDDGKLGTKPRTRTSTGREPYISKSTFLIAR